MNKQPKPAGRTPNWLLGGLSPQQFLSRHWQKKPLLIRQAIPGFQGAASIPTLLELACDDRVESRLISRSPVTPRSSTSKRVNGRWQLQHGPFQPAELRRQHRQWPRDWTLLLQGINLHLPQADQLLARFAFLPWARLDDVMVSYAVPGGGVGPHVDSYDVFLLQGTGRRHWRIAKRFDTQLVNDAPIRVLKGFEEEQQWTLEPGDMLYLPPGWAHDGVAIDHCTTWSIGFRAPSDIELREGWLDWQRDRVQGQGRYRDPQASLTKHPGRIPDALLQHILHTLAPSTSTERRNSNSTLHAMKQFAGCFLSEPKPQVSFEPPLRALSLPVWTRKIARRGLHLDARTRLLYQGNTLFINGEAVPLRDGLQGASARWLRQLADTRCLPAPGDIQSKRKQAVRQELSQASAALTTLLYGWYCQGWLHAGQAAP